MIHRRLAVTLALLLLASTSLVRSVAAEARCFPETGHCLDGRFRAYWEQNGALPVFGYPISAAVEAVSPETRQPHLTQWLERNRFEAHPDQAAPYDVLLGRLGVEVLQQQGRDWFTFPKADAAAPHYFAATGHAVSHSPFWEYWRTHGLDLGDAGISERESLALFGYPISEASLETNASGDRVVTQWFERARFEDHGARGVLLGLLGREMETAAPPLPTPTPDPTPEPAPSCPPLPPSQHSTVTPTCLPGGAMFTIVGIGFQPGERVGFYGAGPNQPVFDLPVLYGDPAARADGTYELRVALPASAQAGSYAITLQGTTSNATAVGYIAIRPPHPTDGPVVDHSQLPPNRNAMAFPDSGPRGTTFTFATQGFEPGEEVTIYAVTADGTVVTAPFTTRADNEGNAANRVEYLTEGSDPVGVYAVTFQSTSSDRTATAYLRLTQ